MEPFLIMLYCVVSLFVFLASMAKISDWSYDTERPAWIAFPLTFTIPILVLGLLGWLGHMLFK